VGKAGVAKQSRWYASLFAQVLIRIGAGVLVGILAPHLGEALKPLGDAFLRMINMVIFWTVVAGLGGRCDRKKVGRVGGKALLYFEVVSTIALLFGALVANLLRPGSSFDASAAKVDPGAAVSLASQAHHGGMAEFLMQIVPTTFFDAFAKGDILPIVFVSVLFGYVLAQAGPRGEAVRQLVDGVGHVVFGMINFLMRLAPLGAFGASDGGARRRVRPFVNAARVQRTARRTLQRGSGGAPGHCQ
jgi:aerobic C4-dicarboxylate transport protein